MAAGAAGLTAAAVAVPATLAAGAVGMATKAVVGDSSSSEEEEVDGVKVRRRRRKGLVAKVSGSRQTRAACALTVQCVAVLWCCCGSGCRGMYYTMVWLIWCL